MRWQGAVKHGRGNGYGAPDLCVMHGPPPHIENKKFSKQIWRANMGRPFLCSDTPGDVLWGINDVEEDEDEAAEDISELPKSLDWISSKKGYESYPQKSLKESLSIPTARILH